MTDRVLSPRLVLAALTLSMLGLVAVDTKPAEAVVACGPRGCVAGSVGYGAPVARAAVAGPVGVGRVGAGVGRPGVGVGGVGRNMGGPVNRVGRR
ncbi:hypothetical protein [Rhodopseudomonas palustris]|nr:hypothetical protein [Rhodopseudomonas palustris]